MWNESSYGEIKVSRITYSKVIKYKDFINFRIKEESDYSLFSWCDFWYLKRISWGNFKQDFIETLNEQSTKKEHEVGNRKRKENLRNEKKIVWQRTRQSLILVREKYEKDWGIYLGVAIWRVTLCGAKACCLSKVQTMMNSLIIIIS